MKGTERHKLKENEFARSVAKARTAMEERQGDIAKIVAAVLLVVAAIAGFAWWKTSRDTKANAAFATALATYEMPVVPPEPPKPGSPPPIPRPGTFQSERDKLEASLPKFLEAANAYPNAGPGIAARFHAAGILAELGRHPEAEQRFKEVVDKAGGAIYGTTARLGMAEAQVEQGKYDSAIAIYSELSRDANSKLPLDSVLMHLGLAYARAGKKEEAVRSFTRVVEEFPQSAYAADARREMEETKKRS